MLYLLTFRPTEHFQSDRIISQFVSREKSLNQFFQEMLEGNSTEDGIEKLVRAS